jgi:2'-5' RNA ligase
VHDLRSALVVEVPEATRAVDDWRERTSSAKPSAGVPAHVTILFPFVPARRIDRELLASLGSLFAAYPAFGFELRDARRFPGLLYLAPEPAERFLELIEAAAAAHPDFPPYGGEFDTIVPHLTAAEGEAAVLDRAAADIEPSLPIPAVAHEVTLLEEVEPALARWHSRARLPLGRRNVRA